MNPKMSSKKVEERLLLLERRVKEKKGHNNANFTLLAEILPMIFFSQKLEKSTKSLLLGLTVAFEGAFTKGGPLALFSEDFLIISKKIAQFASVMGKIEEGEIRLIEKLFAPVFLLTLGLLSTAEENGKTSPEAKEAPHLMHAPFLETLSIALLASDFLGILSKRVAIALTLQKELFPPIIESLLLTGMVMAFSEKEKKELHAGLFAVAAPQLRSLLQKIDSHLTAKKNRERSLHLIPLFDRTLHFLALAQKALMEKTSASFLRILKEEMKEEGVRYDAIFDDLKKMRKLFHTLTQEIQAGWNVKENVISFVG